MIRYDCTAARLEADILAIDPRWFHKAEKRERALCALGHFSEKSSIWSIVKPAFMRLQMNKCIFCERQFENGQYGKIEFDVEHFRPKSTIAAWPDPVRHPKLRYQFPTGAGWQ